MRSCLCNPSIRRQRPSSAARTRPARAAPRAAFPSLPSALLPPKFLTQSHTFSRHLSQSLVHLACPSTLSNALKMLLTSIPSETGTLRANETVESWPSRLPFRNTQFSAQPAPSPLQEPGPPYKLYPSPQDQGGSGPSLHLNKRILSDRTTTVARPQRRRTRRDTLRPSAKFLSERAKKHMNSRGNSRHFAPL